MMLYLLALVVLVFVSESSSFLFHRVRNTISTHYRLQVAQVENMITTTTTTTTSTTNDDDNSMMINEIEDKPLPKVPTTAWRWPPLWPFPEDFLVNTTTFSKKPIPLSTQESITEFVSKFIRSNSKVLEIGTSKYSLFNDLNGKSADKITIDEFMSMKSNTEDILRSYDAVIISSGVESITNPQQFFRKVWKVTKPGGSCHICFTSSPCDDINISTKMWTTMNEEQRLWISGSYFQYSVTGGWNFIEGYDVLDRNTTQLVFEKKDKDSENAYIARAVKLDSPVFDNITSVTSWLSCELQTIENVGLMDVEYLSLRLSNQVMSSSLRSEDFVDNLRDRLSSIYGILKNIKDSIMPKSIQAMLALLIIDQWSEDDTKKVLLKQGLGLELPSEEFWIPIGELTSTLSARDKVLLLADVINADQIKLSNFPKVLKNVQDAIKSKFPDVSNEVVQSTSVNLAVVEYLKSTRQDPFNRMINYIQKTDKSQLEKKLSLKL